MAAIDIQAVANAYFDNADYDEAGSVTKAKAFQTACVRLIGLRPQLLQKGGQGANLHAQFNVSELRFQLQRVDSWLSANDTADPSIVYPNFTDDRYAIG